MHKEFLKMIDESENIVFFGGAGVSTESNIPDFRSDQGLYNAQQKYGISPERMISHSYFMDNMDNFFEYYKENLVYQDAEPNKAHLALAKLEKEGKLKAVVTQNIDGLHEKAGSEKIFPIHGSVARNYCLDCGARYGLDYILDPDHNEGNIPKCEKCGGVVRPDVVLFEEMLNDSVVRGAIDAISNADMLIVGGTSLVVYPAAGMIQSFRGKYLVLINKQATGYDRRADLLIREPIGEVLGELL